MRWLFRFIQIIRNVICILKEGDILPFIEKLLKNTDGSYRRSVFLELPLRLFKIRNFLFIANPKMAREILHHSASLNHPSSPYSMGWVGEVYREELGDILFVISHEKRALIRQSITHFFRQNVDKRFGFNLYYLANELIDDCLNSKSTINATESFSLFASRTVIQNFVGFVEDPLSLHNAMQLILKNVERKLKLKKPLSKAKLEKAKQVIKETSAEACKRSDDGTSLLKTLSEMKDENLQILFSKDEIEAMARFLFLAGQVTVGSVLPALFHHCTENYQEEIRKEWGAKERNQHSIEDVIEFAKKSKWIQALINESCRLFPPAYALVRINKEDIYLEDLFIPKETTIVLCIIIFQKDKKHWGDNAEDFIPQRWFNIYEEGKQIPYMPFGIGPNNCLGQAFARLEIGILLTLFCLRTKWKAHGSYQYSTKSTLSSKNDVLLSVERISEDAFIDQHIIKNEDSFSRDKLIETSGKKCPFH